MFGGKEGYTVMSVYSKMAATHGNLATQLQTKLSDENVSLDLRLETALTVFSSSDIPIVQKEEYVLVWLLQILSECEDFEEKKLLYSYLNKCLQCKRFHNFNVNMKSSVISDLLSALKYFDNYPCNLRSVIRKCCVEMFEISFFKRWFMCDPENVCRLASNYFLSVYDLDTASEFNNVIDQFLYIHKMSLLKNDLRTGFVKFVLIPMCGALSKIPENERKLYFEKAIYFCNEVLLYEPKFIEGYVLLIKSKDNESSKDIKSFVKKIKHLPTKESKDVVEICYSLFLRAVISKYPDESEQIFRIFSSLCPPLGIIINTIISIEMNPVSNWDINNSFEVITSLIDILDNSKIPLTCQLEEVSLQNWFTSMVIGLSNINFKSFSYSFLKMVKRIYEFNPLVIEPTCKVITMIMLQIKKQNVMMAYIELIQSILAGCTKLQRLQKFISFFLENMRDYLLTSSFEENLELEDVLPPALNDSFTAAFSSLPSMQILGVMRSFIFHFERDCLRCLDSSSDQSLVINYGVICELLTVLIMSANVIDYSIPETVKSKYKSQLEDLQVLLKTMGSILRDMHEDCFLEPYLKLCKAFGEVKLLFREYDSIAIVAPMAVDHEPTNISYVHNYLDPDSWRKIAQHIEDHEHCRAANNFYELLIQKIGAISQVEEGSEGPGTQVARYVLNHADPEWLWLKVFTLAPLFQSAELAKLVNKIVRHFGNDQSSWVPLLKEEALTENKQLILALSFCLLHRGSKKMDLCVDGGRPVSKLVLSLLSPISLLDYELSQLIVDDEELKEVVEASLVEMSNILNENLPLLETPSRKTPHLSLFEVPARLPLHHLSVVSQSCALLSAIALLYDLPPGSPADMLLFNLILKILDGPQKNSDGLFSELQLDCVLKFFAQRGKNYRGQRKLMKRVCIAAFRSKNSSKQLFCEVDEPSVSEAWITALVIDCLAQLKMKFIGSKESRKPLERKKCLDRLMNAVLSILCSEPPSRSHLYSFTVVFNYSLRYLSNCQEQFSKLIPLLSEYITLALLDYNEGERLIESLIEHRSELGENFPATLVLSTFRKMKEQVVPPTDSTSHILFAAANISEFKVIIAEMVEETKVDVLKENSVKSKRLLLLWSQLVSSLLSKEKSRSLDEALLQLLDHLISVSAFWADRSAQHLVQPLMNFISCISRNTGAKMQGGVLDCCLELCGFVPLSSEDEELALSNLGSLLDALLSLYWFRADLLSDRLPAFLQRYRHCLNALPPVLLNAPYPFIKRAVPLASKMERLSTNMIKRPKEFGRLAPYLIADIMNIYQHHKLPSDVKFAYDNIINSFLSICDKHAITYLKGILPTGQQELFNGAYENFNKFHSTKDESTCHSH